ncbi:phosphoribosylanthranilate isomerase [Scopulibacillus darangshiensis]|uniref:N-(5'-phosphoribosyl)anthranilate isomerase n=1 Tax=Scopulibacillus darangshiensis TaxID=442528 RepID=A0A4R2P9P1_9BACL|nr:phosphoribosylanthranilate isomerase [Scopulibacillus darangshiensis]TCP31637.1 phosphoribosylanthranilate isomerase [Scopulibacillus darangshiensis]
MTQQPMLKYCGNQSLQDVVISLRSKATHIGLIFTPESKRKVSVYEAESWFRELGDQIKGKKIVGVFVNSTIDAIKEAVNRLPIDIIQCHGNESAEDLLFLKKQIKKPVWKAIHHGDHAIELMRSYQGIASGFVIDTKVQHAWGGSGQSFNWAAVPDYLEEAARQGALCFIAGGIHADNVEKLLHFEPAGIDIASGIETNAKKDRSKIKMIERKVTEHDSAT